MLQGILGRHRHWILLLLWDGCDVCVIGLIVVGRPGHYLAHGVLTHLIGTHRETGRQKLAERNIVALGYDSVDLKACSDAIYLRRH